MTRSHVTWLIHIQHDFSTCNTGILQATLNLSLLSIYPSLFPSPAARAKALLPQQWMTITGNESCRTYEWATSHIRMSHMTHTNEALFKALLPQKWTTITGNESCHTYEWATSHIRMSHMMTHTNESLFKALLPQSWMTITGNESCHTYEWANELRHIYGWVTWHIRMRHALRPCCHSRGWLSLGMSHVTHMHESCHTYERVTSPTHTGESHDTYNETRFEDLYIYIYM